MPDPRGQLDVLLHGHPEDLPVIDLLRAYFQIDSGDDDRKIRERIGGKLLTLDKSLEPALPAFLALLDVTVDDEQWQSS